MTGGLAARLALLFAVNLGCISYNYYIRQLLISSSDVGCNYYRHTTPKPLQIAVAGESLKMKMPKTMLKASVAIVTLVSLVAPAVAMPLERNIAAPSALSQPLVAVQFQGDGFSDPNEGSRGFGGAGNNGDIYVQGGRGYGGAGNSGDIYVQGGRGYGGAGNNGDAYEQGGRGYGGTGNDRRSGGGNRQGFEDESFGSRGYGGAGNDGRGQFRDDGYRRGGYGGSAQRDDYRRGPPPEARRDGYYNGHRGSRERRPGYREYNGYWYPLAAFAAGAILGGALNGGNNRAQPAYGGGHHEWCTNRWRSYRASDNSYQPSYGPRQACVSPFMR